MPTSEPASAGSLLSFTVLGLQVRVDCRLAEAAQALRDAYGLLLTSGSELGLRYAIAPAGPGAYATLATATAPPETAEDLGDLLYLFDKRLTLDLQAHRPDLYFLHAAALDTPDGAVLIAGDSGRGKSSTAWAALRHGFGYLSDELAPVDLDSGRVHAYPRALCLKRALPAPFEPPAGTLRTTRTLHIPAAGLPARTQPRPLRALVFVDYQPLAEPPRLEALSAAAAAARLYTHALNPLRHPSSGLPAAVRLCLGRPCYVLHSRDLGATGRLLADTFGVDRGAAHS